MGKKNVLYRYKLTKVKKKIEDPKTFFTKLLNYCDTIDFSIEPNFRYIIPLKFMRKLKASKK